MKIFYSGIGVPQACPEVVFKDCARVMFSFYHQKNPRVKAVLKAAEQGGSCELGKPEDRYLVYRPAEHFLDSGAFSLWRKEGLGGYEFYRSRKFRQYLEDYCGFIDSHKAMIDLYANVDIVPGKIRDAEISAKLSYRNFNLMRENGLDPVPVVHYGEDLSWLGCYINQGCDLIALGGLVGSINKGGCRDWVSRCFAAAEEYQIRLHGFGLTNYRACLEFPWYSVDSATWDRVSSYGGILVPKKRKGEFDFSQEPWLIKISAENPSIKDGSGDHFLSLSKMEQAITLEWLAKIKVPLGSEQKFGVATRHRERRIANLLFFDQMQQFMDTKEVRFTPRASGFGLF